jgi:hypothetical protein
MARRTVRVRTTALALSVVGAALIAAAIALVVLLNRSLVSNVDAQARMRLDDVASMVREQRAPPTLAGTDDDGTVAEVVAGGRVVAASPLIHGIASLAGFEPPGVEPVIRTLPDPGISGADYRVAAQRVDAADGPALVYAGASLEPVNETTNALRVLLAIGVIDSEG